MAQITKVWRAGGTESYRHYREEGKLCIFIPRFKQKQVCKHGRHAAISSPYSRSTARTQAEVYQTSKIRTLRNALPREPRGPLDARTSLSSTQRGTGDAAYGCWGYTPRRQGECNMSKSAKENSRDHPSHSMQKCVLAVTTETILSEHQSIQYPPKTISK